MCQRNELKPGVLHTYQLSDGKWVVNFPTKMFWRQPSKLQYVQSGLPALVDFVMMNAVGSIAIPALGCGLGGLSWPSVKREIEVAFDVIPSGNVDVWLFPPK
jgi:O-acetyl-ADP-ribose deacetylase (regulator of RNase III)